MYKLPPSPPSNPAKTSQTFKLLHFHLHLSPHLMDPSICENSTAGMLLGSPSQLLLGFGGMSALGGFLQKINPLLKSSLGFEISSLISFFLVAGMVYASAQHLYGVIIQTLGDYYSCSIRVTSEDQLFSALLDYLESQKVFASKEELEEHVGRQQLKAAKEKAGRKPVKPTSLNSRASGNTDEFNVVGASDSNKKLAWYARCAGYSHNLDANMDGYGQDYIYFDSEDSEDESDEASFEANEKQTRKKVKYSPTPNFRHYVYYKPTSSTISIWRLEQEQMGLGWYRRPRETIVLRVFGWDPCPIKALLQDAVARSLSKDEGKTVIYKAVQGGKGTYWDRCSSRDIRPMESIILDEEQKAEITDDIKEYLMPATARWYSNRGLPYRRGYLLYGPPGTGKTSLTMSLAGEFKLKIYSLSLSSTWMNDDHLMDLFSSLPRSCIVLLEDVDACGVASSRDAGKGVPPSATATNAASNLNTSASDSPSSSPTSASSRPSVTLSGLLNVIDGVASKEGRVLVMTTNHRELLDEALIRPGRVDLQIKFANLNKQGIYYLFRKIYDIDEMDREILRFPPSFPDDKSLESLAREFSEIVPKDVFSPAELQGYLLKWKKEPQKAVQESTKWVEEAKKEKTTRAQGEKNVGGQGENEKTETSVPVKEAGKSGELEVDKFKPQAQIRTPPTPPPEASD